MATIADVARAAAVATSTVSHVLNGTRFVRPATAKAVRDAVVAVGYTPNTLARALARQTSNTVGLAVSSTRNRYFADVINAVEAECAKRGMMVLLANTQDDAARELAAIVALHQRRVDGIIIAPTCDPANHALDYLRRNRVPALMLDRLPDFPLDGVGVENHQAMQDAVAHLAQLGHRRIGLLAGQAGFTTALERADGFRAGLARHGLDPAACPIAIDRTTSEAARATAANMLGAVTALIGANNLTTIGIMLAAGDAGLAVPGDLAVLGFDDFEWADAFRPRLTAIVQPCQQIGRLAAQRLQRRIEDPAATPEHIRLAPLLVVRESCGSRPP